MHACMLGDEGSLVGERRWIHSRLRDTCHRGASLPAGSGTTAGAGSGAVVGTGLCTAVRAGNGTTAGAGNGTSVGAGSGTIGAGSGVLGPFATDPSRRQPPRRRKKRFSVLSPVQTLELRAGTRILALARGASRH